MSRALTLDSRFDHLERAVELAEGRLPGDVVERARTVVSRARERSRLGLETTVVALAGATGSGKSSLLNALAGTAVSDVGVRRPTTGVTHAAVWPAEGDGAASQAASQAALLDWLAVPRRHEVSDGCLSGVVVLDLPDYDSVRREHRDEVDRLVELVDLLVWVVDPQKYADAVLHDRYLRRLAGHAAVMVVVLNQVDRLAPADVGEAVGDLRGLLGREGLGSVPVLLVSVRRGDGLDGVRALLRERAERRRTAAERLRADAVAAAEALAAAGGDVSVRRGGPVARRDRVALVDALADVAGVPVVVAAVRSGHRRRGVLRTGWPPARWAARLRPDPLRRLHLAPRPALPSRGRDAPTAAPVTRSEARPVARTSLPPADAAALARARSAVRAVATAAAGDLPAPWTDRLRAVAAASEHDLADRLDAAVAAAPLPGARDPRWWRIAGALQALFAVAAVVGGGWLAARAVAGYLLTPSVVPIPHVERGPLPTLLLVAGVLAGLLLALLARMLNAAGARRRAAIAARRLRAVVGDIADALVIEPVTAELSAVEELSSHLRAIRGG